MEYNTYLLSQAEGREFPQFEANLVNIASYRLSGATYSGSKPTNQPKTELKLYLFFVNKIQPLKEFIGIFQVLWSNGKILVLIANKDRIWKILIYHLH